MDALALSSWELDRAAHACERDGDSARQLDHNALDDAEAEYIIKWLAGSRRHELELAEAGAPRGVGAGRVEPPSQPPARPARVNEKGSDARRLGPGVEPRIRFALRLIASVESAASAPTAGGSRPVRGIDDEVRAVGDELAVDAEHVCDGGFDLLGRIEARAQPARGCIDQRAQGGNVVEISDARARQYQRVARRRVWRWQL